MIKNFFRIKLIFFSTILILLTTVSIGGFYLFAKGPLKEPITLIIPPKIPISEIASNLKQNNIIKSKTLFRFIEKVFANYYTLKSGEYRFDSHISLFQVLKILASGKSIIHKLVVPEGIRVIEIIEKINSETRLQGTPIFDVKEGVLMPATYNYSYGDYKEQLIGQMKYKMSKAIDNLIINLAIDSPIKTKNELLTIASIVEKETAIDSERPIIAAVFLNRLKKNMKLQADPTTIYGITLGKVKFNRKLTKADLDMKSDYNTYYITGLPPGPICCPGIKSIQAVVKPANTKALYFVADGNGGHIFSETLTEHTKNVQIYRDMLIKQKE